MAEEALADIYARMEEQEEAAPEPSCPQGPGLGRGRPLPAWMTPP